MAPAYRPVVINARRRIPCPHRRKRAPGAPQLRPSRPSTRPDSAGPGRIVRTTALPVVDETCGLPGTIARPCPAFESPWRYLSCGWPWPHLGWPVTRDACSPPRAGALFGPDAGAGCRPRLACVRVRAEAGAARGRRVAQDPRSPDECASARGRAGGQAAPAQAGGACGQALGGQASLRVAQAARALPQGPARDPGEEGPAATPCLEPAHGARTRGDERQPRAAREAGARAAAAAA